MQRAVYFRPGNHQSASYHDYKSYCRIAKNAKKRPKINTLSICFIMIVLLK